MQIESLSSIIVLFIDLDPSSLIIRMKITEPIPYGWRLISLEELGLYRSFARKAMEEKTIARIGDGLTFFGSYYGYQIKKENYYQLLAYYRGSYLRRGIISPEQLLLRKGSELAFIYG